MELDEARVKQSLIEMWRKGGWDALVKVLPSALAPDSSRPIGYCTQLKFLVGRTPLEMERAVGLRDNSKLVHGAAIYLVTPLPKPHQFEFRGYSQLPGGIPTNLKPAHPDYPPGRGVPQWELTKHMQSALRLVASVPAGETFRFTVTQIGLQI
jgi:hypothetical protein